MSRDVQYKSALKFIINSGDQSVFTSSNVENRPAPDQIGIVIDRRILPLTTNSSCE
jgi:hypothetical protein